MVRLLGHGVDGVGQILPRAGDALHVGLAAQLAFGTDFARHARHFARERIELIDHGVDGVLQLQNFAAHVHRDLARQVAVGDGRGHFGDVADLGGQVAGHGIDGVRQILPDAADALHLRLSAELAVGADLARHARYFAGERVELIHHRVDGVLQLQNFAAHVDRDLARQVALRHRRGDLGDIADLAGQVAGHGVDRIRQILPDAADALYLRLAAELAFGSHFARHARHLAGERVELIDHGVDGVLQLQNFAARIHRDLRRKIALRHRRGDAGDVADLVGQIAGHGIHAFREIAPRSRDALHFRLTAELAFGSHFASPRASLPKRTS